mmetsp:Transcript_70008/g.123402  ORF Transcript_70008/g.123402 Transcript_70008/m.123402 type:complete len:80 (+) Transcript_70008:277-516(+)
MALTGERRAVGVLTLESDAAFCGLTGARRLKVGLTFGAQGYQESTRNYVFGDASVSLMDTVHHGSPAYHLALIIEGCKC